MEVLVVILSFCTPALGAVSWAELKSACTDPHSPELDANCSSELSQACIHYLASYPPTANLPKCLELIERAADRELLQSSNFEQPAHLPQSLEKRVKRSTTSRSCFLLTDLNLTAVCVDTIRMYGDYCYSTMINVLADEEACRAIRSIGSTCSGNWVKCFTNFDGSGGNLDAVLKHLKSTFTQLCVEQCWQKLFDVVRHCVPDNNPLTKQSFLAEKDFLLETLQVLCSRNSLFQDVSCGELEIKYYLSQHESDVSAGDNKKQCQGTRIVRGSCPNECHLMMSEAKDALGCCIGSQQDFAVANSISDGTDVLANHTYWNRHHCSIRVPDRCSATVISQFREVSDHCKQQLKSLDVPHSCDVDWHALQAVIKLDSFAALSTSCHASGRCISRAEHYIRSLGNISHQICADECVDYLEETLKICSAELQESNSTALIPLLLLCHNTRIEGQSCGVQYLSFMSNYEHQLNSCFVDRDNQGGLCLNCEDSLSGGEIGCCVGKMFCNQSINSKVQQSCEPSTSHEGSATAKTPQNEDASDSNQEDATDSNQEGESDSNLGGIVAGIAVPAVLIIIILGLLLAYYRWKLRKETESGENEPDMPMKSDFFLPESSV